MGGEADAFWQVGAGEAQGGHPGLLHSEQGRQRDARAGVASTGGGAGSGPVGGSSFCWLQVVIMRGLILAVRTAPEVLGMAPPRPSPGSWGTLHLSGTGAPPSPRPHSHPSSHSVPSASTVSWDAELPTQQETGPETRGLVHTLSASWGQKQNWRPGRPDSNPTEQRGAQSCSRSRRRGLWTPPFFPTVQP